MIEWIVPIISISCFVLAIIFSIKLSKEASGEKYWFFFIIAALGFAVAHVLNVLSFFMILPKDPAYFLMELGQILGAASFAYACFGLFSQMKKIRQRLDEE